MEYLSEIYFWLSLAISGILFVIWSSSTWTNQIARLILFINLVMGIVIASQYYL